jgi:hypothetical protein
MASPWWLVMVLVCLTGCAAPWTQVGGRLAAPSLNVEADLPQGWMQFNRANSEQARQLVMGELVGWTVADAAPDSPLFITRDGALLQYINFQRLKVGKDLEHTKKKFAQGLLPQEVAEVELDEVRSDPKVTNFELVENVPMQIDGRPGFKLVYTYRTKAGLELKRSHYGLLLGEWVYRMQYQAPAQYYFERDLETFERVRTSVRFNAKA